MAQKGPVKKHSQTAKAETASRKGPSRFSGGAAERAFMSKASARRGFCFLLFLPEGLLFCRTQRETSK